MPKIPYNNVYPSAARYLIEQGMCATPRQEEKELGWAHGIDITYTLKGMTPVKFKQYADTLLLLAVQEGDRYKKDYKWRFARFEVKLGRLKKGRDLPEVVDFPASMSRDSDLMVYGPGYAVPKRDTLKDKVEDILDIAKRYPGKVQKQNPYKVTKLVISVRQEWDIASRRVGKVT